MRLPLTSWKRRILKRLHRGTVLGIDFGAFSTKIIRWERKEEATPSLTALLYPEKVLPAAPSLERFHRFLVSHHLTELPTAANLFDPSLKTVRIDLPKMPNFDLREAVKWQLRDQIEGSPAEHSFRYAVLDEYQIGEGTRLALMVYLLKKEAVRERMALLRRLSLNPVLLEPSVVALLNATDRVLTWEHGVMLGLVDLGESHADFYGVGDGKLFFSRPLVEISGESLRKVATQELGISEEEAGRHLREMNGLSAAGSDGLMALFCRRLSVEIQRSLDAFSIMYQRRKIDKILFAGGMSGWPGLLEFVAKNVGVKAEGFPPLAGWPEEVKSPFLFSVAAGLALHGSEEGAP